MDTIFQLPLFALVLLQLIFALGLLGPKALSLPIAQQYNKAKANVAANSVVWTLTVVLGGLLVASFSELVKNVEHVKHADVREVVSTIDYLRGQVACSLAAFNLALLFLCRALSEALVSWNRANKNIEAMQRQVKGLQAEYERVTKAGGSDEKGAAGVSEADALKKQVDKLIAEKARLREVAEEGDKAKAAAEANVTAMKAQLKGFDKEYDRVLEENAFLKRKLAGHGDVQYVAELHGTKKDE